MYSAGRTTNIDESTRRQLLDNYLRNQQAQSTDNAFNITSGVSQQFHPSQFQVPPVMHSDQRSETFSDISRRSIASQQHSQSAQHNNLVQVSEQRVSSSNETLSIVPVNELPDNISIDDFTNLVQKWIELDNWIKKSQEIAKQKRKQKDKLGEVITHYMTKFNIEDLNTSEGKIRCKVRYVKSGVNQKVVKEKITELLKDNEETCNTLITKIFDEREKVEKVSLRRIKIT
jgi:Family of unknown function (DUF5760)